MSEKKKNQSLYGDLVDDMCRTFLRATVILVVLSLAAGVLLGLLIAS